MDENRIMSYLGLPIVWHDKEMFGALCFFDSKERKYEEKKIIECNIAAEKIS